MIITIDMDNGLRSRLVIEESLLDITTNPLPLVITQLVPRLEEAIQRRDEKQDEVV